MKVKLSENERFVADWYESIKHNFDDELYDVISCRDNVDDDLDEWLITRDDCIQVLVKMHLFGYEIVSDDVLYYAKFKLFSDDFNFLNMVIYTNRVQFVFSTSKSIDFCRTKFSRSELEGLMIWDNPLFDVVEVE